MKIFLSEKEKNAIAQLIRLHGGASRISQDIQHARKLETRLGVLKKTDWYPVITQVEELHPLLKYQSYWDSLGYDHNPTYGKAIIQVAGFQGTKVITSCLENASLEQNETECIIPAEMISVVGLSNEYLYDGDLLAALTITENFLGIKRFCTSSFVSTPQPENRFKEIEAATGLTFDRTPLDDTHSIVSFVNQGTTFGNLCGIECANDNYILYLDGIIRAAKETGTTFFLNPSWNTIIAGCYLAQLIPEITFKVSCYLSLQSVIHFQLLLSIIKEFQRPDGSSPIVEINIGNAASADTFIQCSTLLHNAELDSIDLSAHIRINTDLGREDYNWFANAQEILRKGYDITLKYERAGVESELDNIAAYFVDDKTRLQTSEALGRILYERCVIATKDAKILGNEGIKVQFASGR